MNEYLELAFSGPALPASCLLALVTAYWLLVIFGAVGLDALDLDLDADMDLDVDAGGLESILSIGMAPLRWLNLGRVPLMLWLSVFALVFWLLSMLWDAPEYRETVWNTLAVILRNGALALLATKLATQPLTGLFDNRLARPATTEDLLGQICVTTTRVTEKSGQATVSISAGTPLILSVRAELGELKKGESAELLEYNAELNYFLVRRVRIDAP